MWFAMSMTMATTGPRVEAYQPGQFGIFAESGLTWKDANGTNLVSWDRIVAPCAPSKANEHCERTEVKVRHHVERDGMLYNLHDLDRELECNDDGRLRLWRPTVHDLDADNIAEITLGLEAGCVTDLTPLDLNVVLWEGASAFKAWGRASPDVVTEPTLDGTLLHEPTFSEALRQRYAAVGKAIGEAAVTLPYHPVVDLGDALESSEERRLEDLARSRGRRSKSRNTVSTRALESCPEGRCTETVTLESGEELSSARLLNDGLEAEDTTRRLFFTDAPKGVVSGYAGASATIQGAANSTNALTCFTSNASTGERMSIAELTDDTVLASVETQRRAAVGFGLGDTLRGYRLDPQSFRVEDGRLILCALSTTDITEGTVLEITIASEGS